MTLAELYQRIPVELGPGAYAEPYDADSFLKMPANALVNAAYLLVGAGWLIALRGRAAPARARGYFHGFALGAIGYAFVQFWRIVSQSRSAAVADQWVTLPFFAGVVALHLALRPAGLGRRSLSGFRRDGCDA